MGKMVDPELLRLLKSQFGNKNKLENMKEGFGALRDSTEEKLPPLPSMAEKGLKEGTDPELTKRMALKLAEESANVPPELPSKKQRTIDALEKMLKKGGKNLGGKAAAMAAGPVGLLFSAAAEAADSPEAGEPVLDEDMRIAEAKQRKLYEESPARMNREGKETDSQRFSRVMEMIKDSEPERPFDELEKEAEEKYRKERILRGLNPDADL